MKVHLPIDLPRIKSSAIEVGLETTHDDQVCRQQAICPFQSRRAHLLACLRAGLTWRYQLTYHKPIAHHTYISTLLNLPYA